MFIQRNWRLADSEKKTRNKEPTNHDYDYLKLLAAENGLETMKEFKSNSQGQCHVQKQKRYTIQRKRNGRERERERERERKRKKRGGRRKWYLWSETESTTKTRAKEARHLEQQQQKSTTSTEKWREMKIDTWSAKSIIIQVLFRKTAEHEGSNAHYILRKGTAKERNNSGDNEAPVHQLELLVADFTRQPPVLSREWFFTSQNRLNTCSACQQDQTAMCGAGMGLCLKMDWKQWNSSRRNCNWSLICYQSSSK